MLVAVSEEDTGQGLNRKKTAGKRYFTLDYVKTKFNKKIIFVLLLSKYSTISNQIYAFFGEIEPGEIDLFGYISLRMISVHHYWPLVPSNNSLGVHLMSLLSVCYITNNMPDVWIRMVTGS